MKDFAAYTIKWIFWALAFSIIILIPVLLFCPPAFSHPASWCIAIYVLVFAPWAVFQLSKYCSKTWIRLALFAVILVLGSIFYSCDFRHQQEHDIRQAEQSAVAVKSPEKTPSSASDMSRETPGKPSFDFTVKKDNCDYLFFTMIGIFAALSEFFPSRGSYRDWLSYSPWLKGAFLLFYLFAYMFVASFLLSLLGRKLINRISLLWSCFFSERKYVFWCKVPSIKEKFLAAAILGKNREVRRNFRRQADKSGASPARAESSKREYVIFSVKESDIKDIQTFIDQMQFAGFLLCLRKPAQFHKECLTAKRHFFLTDDLNWNFRQARKVLENICAKKQSSAVPLFLKKFLDKFNFNKIPEEIHFYLRVTDDEKAYWAVLWAEKMQAMHEFLVVHLINEEAIVARQLQLRYPLLSEKDTPDIKIDHASCKVSGSFRILLLGFSDGGQAVLREMVCNGQFLHTDPNDRFSVDVVDRNAILTSGYAARYPDAVRTYNISFINKEVLSGDFYSWLQCNLPRYNRIIVSFWNDDLNLELAAIICRLGRHLGLGSREGSRKYMQSRLYVRFSRFADSPDVPQNPFPPRATAESAGEGSGVFPEFRIFGCIEDCYSKEVIIDENLDRKAERVHRIYWNAKHASGAGQSAVDSGKSLKEEAERDWRKLVMFLRESNRATADRFRNQLILLGMTEKDLDPRTEFDPGKERMEALAETGHLHWNAFHLMHGIRPWPMADISDEDCKRLGGKANDITEHLRHAAIVDYADLPKVEQRLGLTDTSLNNFQNNERNLIKNMGFVLCDDDFPEGK